MDSEALCCAITKNLNTLINQDPDVKDALQRLIDIRVQTTEQASEFLMTTEDLQVGLLGIMNGLVSPTHVIVAVSDEDGNLAKFNYIETPPQG